MAISIAQSRRAHRLRWILTAVALLLSACHDDHPTPTAPTDYSVTFSGAHLHFSLSSPQRVVSGSSETLTVTADTNYTRSDTVGGTCAAGTWAGDVYTTGVVTAACTLAFSAAINTLKVTASGSNLTIDPSAPQTVNAGATQSFTVTAATGYTLADTVTGTCAAGALVGSVYTTGAVTADCTVIFSAALTPAKAGDCVGGGVVFYVNSAPGAPAGQRGLIAALTDASVTPLVWVAPASAPSAVVTQAKYFTGLVNTNAIINIAGTDALAAIAASSYTSSVGCDTCSPWYLPSQDELTALFAQSDSIGTDFWTACSGTSMSTTTAMYWSSTQDSATPTSTWLVYFQTTQNTGASFSTVSTQAFQVRAIRAF